MIVLFLTVKLLHELFHLLHRAVSPKMKGRRATPPQDRIDKMLNGSEQIVEYRDFGTLMERDSLGGCWELSSERTSLFMVPEFVVLYPSVDTKVGQYLDVNASTIDGNGARVVTYGTHKSRTVSTFVTSTLQGGMAQMSEYVAVGSGSFDEFMLHQEEEGDEAQEEEVWFSRT